MPVLDIADDLGATLIHALDGRTPAEILKTAEWREPYEGLDRDFALILVDEDGEEHRKYACHDAGNTLVSMFYLEHAVGHLNPAAIKVAATNLALLGEHQGLTITSEFKKLAEVTLLDDRDILDERKVRFHTPSVPYIPKVAAGPFGRARELEVKWVDMGPSEKRAAALELDELNEAVPVGMPHDIFRYSGRQLSEKFAGHMRCRLTYVRDPELAAEYDRLGKVAGVLEPDQVVSVLYELDNRSGLRWGGGDRYGEKIADPFLCVYDRVKEAEWSWLHGSESVSEDQLRRFLIKPRVKEFFTQTFSEGLWLRFAQDPVNVFQGLPVEQQILISRMARQFEGN